MITRNGTSFVKNKRKVPIQFLALLLGIMAFSIYMNVLSHVKIYSAYSYSDVDDISTLNNSESVGILKTKNIATTTIYQYTHPTFTNTSVVTNITSTGKFAYTFLVAGINPKNPTWRGYIYSVIVSKHLFTKTFHTVADVILLLRIHADSPDTKLPKEDEELLRKSNITFIYLPKPKVDNFHTAMMDKFRIMELDEYERIVYLDADVIPLNNLDYLFHLSKMIDPITNQPYLQENIGLAYNNEPMNGGLFMLKPNKTEYMMLTKIVEKVERQGYHFNQTIGWGHVMDIDDKWESLTGPVSNTWSMYGGFTVCFISVVTVGQQEYSNMLSTLSQLKQPFFFFLFVCLFYSYDRIKDSSFTGQNTSRNMSQSSMAAPLSHTSPTHPILLTQHPFSTHRYPPRQSSPVSHLHHSKSHQYIAQEPLIMWEVLHRTVIIIISKNIISHG